MAIKDKTIEFIIRNLITLLMLVGVIIGVLIAIIMHAAKEEPYTPRQIMYVGFLGELFLQLLQLVALPLMIAAITAAVGSLDTLITKRIRIQLILFIAVMKLISVSLGVLFAVIIKPGRYGSSENGAELAGFVRKNITTVDTFLDVIRNLFPPNIIDMHLRTHETTLIRPENGTDNMFDWKVSKTMKHTTNMLGVVNCSLFLGIALATMKNEGKIMTAFFVCVSRAVMIVTIWILWIGPVLVMFLIIAQLLKTYDLSHLMSAAGVYVTVMILGYSIQCAVMYPLVYFLLVRKNPFIYMRGYLDAMLTAFTTSSSVATIPVSIQCLDNIDVDKRLSRLVIPLAHNISMDGAAFFEGVASFYIAQLNRVTLEPSSYVSVIILGSAASVAAPGVPFSATVCLVMLLHSIGLPIKDVGILLALDCIIDRCSTVVNVLGDYILVGILAHINKELLESSPNAENELLTDMESQKFD